MPKLPLLLLLRIVPYFSVFNQVLRVAQATMCSLSPNSHDLLFFPKSCSLGHYLLIIGQPGFCDCCNGHLVLFLLGELRRDRNGFGSTKVSQRFFDNLELFPPINGNRDVPDPKNFWPVFFIIFDLLFLAIAFTVYLSLLFEILKVLFFKALTAAFINFQILIFEVFSLLLVFLKLSFYKIDILLALSNWLLLFHESHRPLHLCIQSKIPRFECRWACFDR